MAFIDKGWFLDTSWIDTGGNTASRRFQLVATDTAGDISAIITDVQAIVAAWIAATDCVLTKQFVGKLSVEDSVVLPAGDVNVEEQLQVSAKIFGTPNKSAVFEIMGPKNTLFKDPTGEGHNKADFADAALSAVVNLYINGGKAFISDGESITVQNIKGKRTHHKSSKG